MPKNFQPPSDDRSSRSRASVPEFPKLSLPKGGGAIHGIGEKFASNPVSGSGQLTIPVYTSPGRSGFGPELTLTYDSGSGNGPFGFGWSLSLPAISRKTDKGLPQYQDGEESDIFLLSGTEDLVPSLVRTGGLWQREVFAPRTLFGKDYEIHCYRPRVEGLFARIERWRNISDPADTFWRSISKDNIRTWYGKTAESRIADPGEPQKIFSWLIEEASDGKGNVVVYRYKAEDSSGVDLAQSNERNRSATNRSAGRYLKSVTYGNRTPYLPDLNASSPTALPTDWCFELVFDYGEHDFVNPLPQETTAWDCRKDPFSTYRPTFEVRTYRLCRRALMFHHFPNVDEVGMNSLVRSTEFLHAESPPDGSAAPFYSFLLSVQQTGYVRNTTGGYLASSFPPVEFDYSQATIDEDIQDLDDESLANLPSGMDGSHYRWVDLDGEGVSGVLTEQGGAWQYKPNLSPAKTAGTSSSPAAAAFGPIQVVASKPSLASLSQGRQQLMSLSGDGRLDLVEFGRPVSGFFERTENGSWRPFQTFRSLPVLDWQDPNLRFIDLTGDGIPDLLISEDDVFQWHYSLSSDGFGDANRVPQSLDEEQGPQLIFSDGTETIFLADMSGDGLTDLVRVRSGEVCYWPNLGYGRFGAKVSMDGAPLFDGPAQFDARRLRLADIDGSGTTDLLYFASDGVQLYFNQSGNAWGAARTLRNFPLVNDVSTAAVFDLLGNGTACLVWSSPLPTQVSRPMRFIDLMGGQKPHLLVRMKNNLGGETRVVYVPSTKFYVQDKLAGTPWLTRIPFPVHVVERVETYDYISRNRFVTRYSYHHGYFDGIEREFRGFGRVDQLDTEELATLGSSSLFPAASNESAASAVPPVLTKTWYHTGIFFGGKRVSKHFESEYYAEGDSSEMLAGLTDVQLELMLLDDTVFPTSILQSDGTVIPYEPSGEEIREACRALRGSILRQEIYGLDGTDQEDRPYVVSERNYTIEILQPQGTSRFGVFLTHPRETVDFHYERKLFTVVGNQLTDEASAVPGAKKAADPRVTHTLMLAADGYGNVLQSVSIGYGRRYLDPGLPAQDQVKQSTPLLTYTENSYTNAVLLPDSYRAPLPSESSTYELLQIQPAKSQEHITNLFEFSELRSKVQAASDGAHDIPFENAEPNNLTAGEPYRRLIGRTRTYFRPDDMGAVQGSEDALGDLGELEPQALPGATYRLAFTPGLVGQVYVRGGVSLLPSPADVLGSAGSDGGGYVDLDHDGNWWLPSGRVFYSTTAVSPANEEAQAKQNFFLVRRFVDPFGTEATVDYDDPHKLFVEKTLDAVGNSTAALYDYRVLAPVLLTDPNGNRAGVKFDALAKVAGTVVMGKTTEILGDSFATFSPDLDPAQIETLYGADNPHIGALDLLGTATTRIVYDLFRFLKSQQLAPDDPTTWQPIFTATIARETHVSDLMPGQQSKSQTSFVYADGFGREIQKKIQAEPGPVREGGPIVNPRWVGSGWTIFNNKGQPVRKYEPFFSQLPTAGHHFEFGMQVGISPILCYDPTERVVATIHPNRTYEKTVFDPWHQETWDVNDTVLAINPKSDADVGALFSRLPSADFSPTWYSERLSGGLGTLEQLNAAKAALHANTPMISYCDVLGRGFFTLADNGAAGKYLSRIVLNIDGTQRSVYDLIALTGDQQGRMVVRYDYDLLGNHIHQGSMEAGERWTLVDSTGKHIRSWDSRGHNFRTEYDALRRPTGAFVFGADSTKSDARTTASEVLYEKTTYGDGQPLTLNLRTRVFEHVDAAGIVTNKGTNPTTGLDEGFDFKGNPLRSSRGFFADYVKLPNLSLLPLTPDVFDTSMRYDALNRVISVTAPDGSVIDSVYNEANLLEAIALRLHGSNVPSPLVTNIDYDSRGQRVLIEYGNGSRTTYTHDPETFRLSRLATLRPGFSPNQQSVQDLNYVSDPVGNITHIDDFADIQNVVFFRNQRVDPSNDFNYDAIYRLIAARGREQLGLIAGAAGPVPSSYNDVPRTGLLLPGDGQAMGTYTEEYHYDSAGNFIDFVHRGSSPANPGWSRTYTHSEPSLLEAGKVSNRLTQSTVSGNIPLIEPYSYDGHGNMVSMPQLQSMIWTFKDELHMTQRQAVNSSDAEGVAHQGERTYYVYDSNGQRVRKVTESPAGIKKKERFYIGGFELYRELSGGTTALARETLHVMDDKQRVAVVETRTQGIDAAPGQLLRYQFGNHLGSACLELDDAGHVISYEEYCPYGSTSYQAGRSVAELNLKRYRYTGMERDEESGLSYHRARYCCTWLGRWVSADPAGTADSNNLYGYARQNPLRNSDRTGLGVWSWIHHNVLEPTADFLERHGVGDAVAGFGDTLSFGLTRKVRQGLDVDSTVNYNSTAYKGGSWAGVGLGLAIGGAGAWNAIGRFGVKRGIALVAGFVAGQQAATAGLDRVDPSGWSSGIFNTLLLISPIREGPAAGKAKLRAPFTEAEINAAVEGKPSATTFVRDIPAKALNEGKYSPERQFAPKPYGNGGRQQKVDFDYNTSAPNNAGQVKTTARVHDPDPTAPAGSTSRTEPTLAIEQAKGNRRLVPDQTRTSGGRWVQSGTASSADWGASHIPLYPNGKGPLPLGSAGAAAAGLDLLLQRILPGSLTGPVDVGNGARFNGSDSNVFIPDEQLVRPPILLGIEKRF